MAVSRRLRFEILRRDDHTCRYCGASAPDVPLTVDHVKPVALGGSDAADNLVTACRDCNTGKASVAPDSSIVANVADDALRWARAMDASAAALRRERSAVEQATREVDDAWVVWGLGEDRTPLPRPQGWIDSVERFFTAGVPVGEMVRFVGVAMRKAVHEHGNPRPIGHDQIWRYFCGCCWRTLDDMAERAAEIVAAELDHDEWMASHGT